MSSFYEDASLVMIPSGYKTSKVYCAKPTDGAGDLTFTRSNDTATRVNSAGLIEKVRTNLNLYSEQMDNAYYTKTTGTTVTANNAANPIDGALTADTINYDGTGTSGNYRIYSSPVATSVSGYEYTWSVWLRCATPTTLILNNNRASTAVNVTSTWQRFSVTGIGNGVSSIQTLIYSNTGNNSPFALEVFGQQVEIGVMTDYIATTSAAVSVGPVANVPRLDYLNSSCPRLLLEPQRTNLVPYSEQLSQWSLTNATLTSNDAISPDGYKNADKVVTTATGCDVKYINVPVSASTTYTASFWVKLTSGTGLQGRFYDNSNSSNIEYYTYDSQLIVGQWSRVKRTFTTPAGCTNIQVWYLASSSSATVTAHFWGFQLEAGAYATSYIPTLGAAVTRGADDPSKTGISSLIGSEAGTMYLEFSALANDLTERRIAVSNGTTANVARIGYTNVSNRITAVLFNGANQCVLAYDGADITQTVKVAFTWAVNDFALFVNGVKRSSDNSGTTFAANTLSQLQFDRGDGGPDPYFGKIDGLLLFKSRLSDSQLAELTA